MLQRQGRDVSHTGAGRRAQGRPRLRPGRRWFSDSLLSQKLPEGDIPADLIGPFVDLSDLGIAPSCVPGVLLHVSIPSEDLNCVGRHPTATSEANHLVMAASPGI